MSYKNTQIGPDGKRHKIEVSPDSDDELVEKLLDMLEKADPVEEVSEESEDKNASNQSGGSFDSSIAELDAELNDDGEVMVHDPKTEEDEKFPKHLGRGVYQLRSGEKVQGKAKAAEAQKAEDEANDDSSKPEDD